MTHTIILSNGVTVTQRDNSDRSAWTPIDRSDEIEHAARLADAKVKACERQAFVDCVDATDCSSQWSDRGQDH